jgi:GH25 family lysozyme M1 (1,4-beta-N-acetylmuramidase)
MNIADLFRSWIRRLQGERRGMGSQLTPPTLEEEALLFTLYPDLIWSPTILIQTLVRLADVSFWQGAINFLVMLAAGISGVIIRAGQGGWEDIKFLINWALAKAAGLPRGSYWFYDSRKAPREQALLWWSLIKDDPGELVHVADFEESYGGPYGTKAHFKEFLLIFQQLSGLPNDRIAIYTGFFWWVARVGNDIFFKRYQLWLASYGAQSQARIPDPWDAGDLLFWQYTASGNGAAYGVSSREIDLNWYCCDQVAFGKRFPLISSEPPTGEPMTDYIYKITPTASNGSKIRPEPDTGNTPLSISLPYGKYAYGNRRVTIAEDRWEIIEGVNRQVNKAGDVWLEVSNVDGTDLVRPAYIAEIHLGQRYATITQIGTPPEEPPAEPDEEIVITQTFSSPGYVSQTVTTTLKPNS